MLICLLENLNLCTYSIVWLTTVINNINYSYWLLSSILYLDISLDEYSSTDLSFDK